MPPLVSLVVPVFNGMPHLEDLVPSLLSQTYAELEIIFSVGGGSDSSGTYLDSLDDPRVRVIHATSGAPTAAANWTTVTQSARGAYVKLVCQDDLLYSSAVEHQVADLEGHPTAVMAVGQRDIIDAAGTVVHAPRGLAGLAAGLCPGERAIRACYLSGTNLLGEPLAVLFRREPLLGAMPWDDSIPLVLDLSTYERVAHDGDIVVRRQSIGAFRVSTSSWSTRLAKVQLQQFQQWQQAYERSAHTSRSDRLRARAGVLLQTSLRRAAYSFLRMRGGLGPRKSAHHG